MRRVSNPIQSNLPSLCASLQACSASREISVLFALAWAGSGVGITHPLTEDKHILHSPQKNTERELRSELCVSRALVFQQGFSRSPSAPTSWDQTRCHSPGCSELRFVLALSTQDFFSSGFCQKGATFPSSAPFPVIVSQKNFFSLLSSFPKALPAVAGSRQGY